MTTELLDDIHPGKILLEDFMKPLGITARQLAADMDMPPSGVSDIVNGNPSSGLKVGRRHSRRLIHQKNSPYLTPQLKSQP